MRVGNRLKTKVSRINPGRQLSRLREARGLSYDVAVMLETLAAQEGKQREDTRISRRLERQWRKGMSTPAKADLVFRIKPFSEPKVISRKLMTVHYGLYAADKLPDLAFDGADDVPLILMDEAFGSMPDVAWLRELCPNASIALRSNNRDVQARLCHDGAGLAVLPRPLGDSLAGLKRLDPPAQPPSRQTWLGYHRDLRRFPRLRAFLNAVIHHVGQISATP